jgi:hypothetical protein
MEFQEYKVSSLNESMENFPQYLEEVSKIKESIGNRYRSASTERKLAAWEQAIAILTRRREVLKTSHYQPVRIISRLVGRLLLLTARNSIGISGTQYLSSPSQRLPLKGLRLVINGKQSHKAI